MRAATFVPPSGPMNAKMALVGEQPGRFEVQNRKPFVGPAGNELNNCLAAANISRSECYLTNVIKDLDKPLERYILFDKKGEAILSPAGADYIKMLKGELENITSNVIVAVGNVALWALTSRHGITKWRGSILESTLLPGRKVVPIIHPATVIPPKNVYTNRFLIMTDLARAAAESESSQLLEYDLRTLIEPSFEEVLAYLDECIKAGLSGTPVSLDIEVVGPEITCISLSTSPHLSMSIPFVSSKGDYFTIDQEAAIWKILAAIIEDPRISILGQNIIFDLSFIFRKYGIRPSGPIHCTMIAQKILYPDFNVGLDFITSLYTRLPYYKADGKQWMKIGGAFRTFWNYNALDSAACSIAWPRQMADLKTQDNIETYERKCRIMPPLMFMSEKGIKVNLTGFMKEREKTQAEITETEQKLWDKVGYQINYNSPKQLLHYFYEEQKHQPYRKRQGNKWIPTTDEMAMKRLSRKGVTEAELILTLRGLSKRLGTYLDPNKLSKDSRVRCQYKPHGAKTGRYSSSEDIFGEGMNQQNWPHDLLQHLEPDEGYIRYFFDLGQAENRLVAYVGRVIPMIEAFENDIDLHRLTGGLIFNKPWNEVSDEPGSCSLGGGKYSERFWGKKGNHSLNYDFGYKSFALKYEIPEAEAKWIVERYHSVYPEVRQVYHKMIRDQLQKDRTLVNLYGRKRLFLGRWDDELFKEAYAHIPQSTVADKIDNEGISYIWYSQMFNPIDLLAQVHDSVVFQIPLALPWEEHARMLIAIKVSLETPLVWHEREFVIPADLNMGLTLNKETGKDFKSKKIPADPAKLALLLHDTYAELRRDRERS